jgi:hypothetical protein
MESTAEAVNERLRGLGNWVSKVHFSECFVVLDLTLLINFSPAQEIWPIL